LKEYALIVAGGRGTRFGSPLAKQFLTLAGKPVLLHTIEAFYAYSPGIEVVLVLPRDDFEKWEAICRKHRFNKPLQLQEGGTSRFQSVKRGLEKLAGDGLVAIHDGVRPLVSTAIIKTSFELAAVHQCAVACVPLKESLRMQPSGKTERETLAVDRTRFRLVQTPQTFQLDVIRQAYAIPEESSLTDDASVAERAGYSIFLFEGSYRNIKITTPDDLIIAQALLDAQRRT
jgi:2-C-methyl-D-erythritol 4-phosphate cytidylyltransferase